MFDLISEIAQTIRNNKLRTALTGLAVAWGIFMLIVLLGASRGVSNAFEDQMATTDQNTIEIYGGYTTKPYKGYDSRREIKLKDNDVEAIERMLPGFAGAALMSDISAQTISGPKGSTNAQGQAVLPGYVNNINMEIKYGRFINENDIRSNRKTIVIPESKAKTLFGDAQSAIGKEVKMMDLSWTVVGIYDHRWRSSDYIPYSTYKMLTGSSPEVYKMVITVDGLETEEDGINSEDNIRKTIARKHDFAPDDKGGIWTYNNFTSYLQMHNGMGYLNIAVWVIGILTLISGIVGVSNIMFVSVKERTHEIGIRRAIGAKPISIVVQILSESVAITTLFGYIGIVLGMIVLEILNKFFGQSEALHNPTLDISIAVEVTIAMIIAGAAAGLFPAMKAVKVKPVEALRDE